MAYYADIGKEVKSCQCNDKYVWKVTTWGRCMEDEREQMKARNYSFHMVGINYTTWQSSL